MTQSREDRLLTRIAKLNELGIALSAERDTGRLLERILEGAQDLTGADAGTLYLVSDDGAHLRFEILRNATLGIAVGGTTGAPVPYPTIALHDRRGRPDRSSVAARAAIEGRTFHVADAYAETGFDLTATRAMDRRTGYFSRSLLTIPMKNHEAEVVGVLQLINALHPASGEVTVFGAVEQRLAESLASQAAVALTNKALLDAQKQLFESFVQLVARAIDEKNPATGRHCQRVPELTMMLADAAVATDEGPLREFGLTEDERFELKVAAWLHDCGKIATPESLLGKATKLETVRDRIHEVEQRFEILARDAEIAALCRRLAALGAEPEERGGEPLDEEHRDRLERLRRDRAFLARANRGGERMRLEDQLRVAESGRRYRWRDGSGAERPLLDDEEIERLQVVQGTLTEDERRVVQDHARVTLEMLRTLRYPRGLREVPEIAGSHHERMDGRGYPRGLTAERMSVQARMLALADVFEALSAADRAYKCGKPLSEALRIMGRMVEEGHIDPVLFDCFVRQGVYLQYARRFIAPEQIDAVDLDALPGYPAGGGCGDVPVSQGLSGGRV